MTAEEIYRDLARQVLGFLRARRSTDPEDLTGEVFLQVSRDLPRFRDADDPAAVRRWVFTIARNRAIDAERRARRRPVQATAVLPEVEAPATAAEIDEDLLAALAALTDDQREVVTLRFVADLPLEDVARITRRSTGATKSLQHRALENLRQAVSPEGPATL